MERTGPGKLKHIQTRYLWIQERVRARELSVHTVSTLVNPADLGTKIHDVTRLTGLLLLVCLVPSRVSGATGAAALKLLVVAALSTIPGAQAGPVAESTPTELVIGDVALHVTTQGITLSWALVIKILLTLGALAISWVAGRCWRARGTPEPEGEPLVVDREEESNEGVDGAGGPGSPVAGSPSGQPDAGQPDGARAPVPSGGSAGRDLGGDALEVEGALREGYRRENYAEIQKECRARGLRGELARGTKEAMIDRLIVQDLAQAEAAPRPPRRAAPAAPAPVAAAPPTEPASEAQCRFVRYLAERGGFEIGDALSSKGAASRWLDRHKPLVFGLGQ